MIVIEPTRIELKVDSTGSITPDKAQAIDLAHGYLRSFELDIGDWTEMGAHQDSQNEHIWIVGFRRK